LPRGEAATRVDALTEARDTRLAVHLHERAVDDVGDEQPRRVRAEVDGRDPHLRGYARPKRWKVAFASSSASRRTASRARSARSRERLDSSCSVSAADSSARPLPRRGREPLELAADAAAQPSQRAQAPEHVHDEVRDRRGAGEKSGDERRT
jgi:hypothetical protein